jgi:copper resistance protein C
MKHPPTLAPLAAPRGWVSRSGRPFPTDVLRVWLSLIGMLVAAPAFAHAFLDHAIPAVGSTVHAAPREVRLWFSESLEPAFSRLQVLDASGKSVDAGDGHVDPGDRTILTATLAGLPPGTYRVVWRVVSIDTHVTEGDFTFDVAP